MPYIKDNINLTILLADKSVPLKDKLIFLKKAGDILENVQGVTEFKNNFFLGDVHSGNFVVNIKDLKLDDLHAVDLDSSRIGDNLAFPSKILSTNFNLKNKKKYKLSKNGLIEPDANTEWLCYSMMILNFIGNFNINRLSEVQFDKYLQYLEDLGFNQELINIFSKVYTEENNLNPKEFIETIPADFIKADYSSFKRKL